MEFIDRPSPNFDKRTRGIDMLLLHYTGMPTGEEAMAKLCDPAAKVSAHYTVEVDGRIFAHVAEEMRAWHAGVSCWKREPDVNSRSIGIEIVNPGHEFGYVPFPEEQIKAVIELSKEILDRHKIPASHVLGHSDVAPDRKQDPGELFPWKRLANEGVGNWAEILVDTFEYEPIGPDASHGAVAKLQRLLARVGYCIPVDGGFDDDTGSVVTAFQRHYCQDEIGTPVEGQATPSMIALLEHLSGRA